jgi:two-component system sensor histidine kinase DesK
MPHEAEPARDVRRTSRAGTPSQPTGTSRSTVAGMSVVTEASASPGGRAKAWWARARSSASARNARGWYGGACFGLLYQFFVIIAVWTMPTTVFERVLTTLLLAVFYAAWVMLPPLLWWAPRRDRILTVVLYWLYSCIFFPILGTLTLWLWVLVAAMAAVLFEEFVLIAPTVAVLVAVPVVLGLVTGFADSAAYSAIIIFAISTMLYSMNKQIRVVRELREAQGQIARLAVVEERARFSRDMHDVLGHSLTVVAVKSELARRLISRDPAAAEVEIADIERLSRSALADLRAAVSGYREMSLSTELAVAQAALASANISAHLPNNGEGAERDLRELFGWVLREGVTNVIRHSGAAHCWVDVTATSLTVADDGRGWEQAPGDPSDDAAPGQGANALQRFGNGLDGLQERASESGAILQIGTSIHGGCQLLVRKATA